MGQDTWGEGSSKPRDLMYLKLEMLGHLLKFWAWKFHNFSRRWVEREATAHAILYHPSDPSHRFRLFQSLSFFAVSPSRSNWTKQLYEAHQEFCRGHSFIAFCTWKARIFSKSHLMVFDEGDSLQNRNFINASRKPYLSRRYTSGHAQMNCHEKRTDIKRGKNVVQTWDFIRVRIIRIKKL